MNTNPNLRVDSITQSVNELALCINKERHGLHDEEDNDSDDEIRPFRGFAKPLSKYKTVNNTNIWTEKTNRLLQLLKEHVDEALQNGFDDSIAKYKGKSHFVVGRNDDSIDLIPYFLISINSSLGFFRFHLVNRGMRCSNCCTKYSLKIQTMLILSQMIWIMYVTNSY